MARLSLFALALLAVPALAQDQGQGAADPMAGWAPRKVAREARDRKEILALLAALDRAGQKGDLSAAAALVDFPVLMVTDDSKGQASAESWSREQWTKVMEPMYAKPMEVKVAHRPVIVLASDSLATLTDTVTMTTGKKAITTRNTTILVRKDGRWLVKAMMEGGWGEMMAAPPAGAAGSEASAK